MVRRKIEPPLPQTLKSDVVGRTHEKDILKELYRSNQWSIEKFARETGLSIRLVEKLITEGDWERLRQEYRDQIYNTMNKDRQELLELKQSLVQRFELFYLMAAQSLAADLEEYVKKHGDFFVRTADDEIARDGFGNPLFRRLSLHKAEMEQLKGLEAAREINRQLLIAANAELKELDEEKKRLKNLNIIDADVEDFFDKDE